MWPLLASWLAASRCQPRRRWPKLIDVAGTVDWRWITGVSRQSIGPKPDSRPRLEGARYKYLTKLLMPTQLSFTLQSRTHSHTSLTRLLPSWVNAMGLLEKGLSVWVQSRLDPCPEDTYKYQVQKISWSFVMSFLRYASGRTYGNMAMAIKICRARTVSESLVRRWTLVTCE